jgi:hypothetical protein
MASNQELHLAIGFRSRFWWDLALLVRDKFGLLIVFCLLLLSCLKLVGRVGEGGQEAISVEPPFLGRLVRTNDKEQYFNERLNSARPGDSSTRTCVML